ncbi:S8 family peptidase [Chryseobacterium caseinilyticum]|nr:S8 family peptidase [Chryseobacterium caseinilyticum]
MKKNLLLAGLLAFTGIFAQTKEELEIVRRDINSSEFTTLQQKFALKYQKDQEKIKIYLKNNPDAVKQFERNGNSYLLHHIDDEGNPIYINTKDNNQITNTKANALHSGGSMNTNITGLNMVAGVWDGGQVNALHELLTGKVTMQSGQTVNTAGGNDHMQAVSGIIAGKVLTSSANPGGLGLTAKGIAYDATILNYDWDNDIAEMTAFAGQGYLISNHSYGYSNTTTNNVWNYGAYDDTAKSWDELLKVTPNYLPFVAAGNEQQANGNSTANGFDIITGATAAKNVMTVGAVNADNTMSDYSNWGPTDDGRVKPDIVTLGTAINVPKYTGNSNYTGVDVSSSGTSYAAPAAAAAGLLLQQYYKSIYGTYMKAASLKALMLHTADDAGNPGPDAKFGWGILNVERAAQTIRQMQSGGSAKLVEFTTNPSNDSSAEISTTGIAGGSSARASICWTDNEGTEQTAANGINNPAGRLVYNFDILFRQQGTPFIDTRPYAPLSISNPNATVSASTAWFTNSVDNYKQANIATTNQNNTLIVYVRKTTSSPSAVRNFSVLLTGLKITSATLAVSETQSDQTVVFYNAADKKIKMISNNRSDQFGDFKIYDMSGKVIQSGHEKTNEIAVSDQVKGVYILMYKSKNKPASLRFRN